MSCFNKENISCVCNFNTKNLGVSDLSKISFNGADRTTLNWSEISVPEILKVPALKPDIENLDQVFAEAVINCARLIETPYSFTIYDLPLDIALVTPTLAALNALAAITIQPIIDAVNAILAIPGLIALPGIGPIIAQLNATLMAVENAFNSLEVAVDAAITALTGVTCIETNVFINLINEVIVAANLLLTALSALSVVGADLVAATAGVPIIGDAVAAAVVVLDAAIDVVVAILEVQIQALLDIITPLGTVTQVLVINPNAEDTCLSGRKLVIEGVLKQKVVYTGLVTEQSVHSATFDIPFSSFVIPYAKFCGLNYQQNITVLTGVDCETAIVNGFPFDPNEPIVVDLCEEFNIEVFIEDIFTTTLDNRTIFKNVTLFFRATPVRSS